jgi:FPC/CPF motif-containing protein YcgG
MFDALLWERLNALSTLDRLNFKHDSRVDADPTANHYSYSLKQEAFFIIGLNPFSSRKARRFAYPTLVFNPHAEFEKLKKANRYAQMKKIVRKRDLAFSGSVNPLLNDFGEASEVYQYSGVHHDENWKCPLHKK